MARTLRGLCLIAASICFVGQVGGEDLTERAIDESERDHWAYHPVRSSSPPKVSSSEWSCHPLDCFIRHQLDQAGLEPVPIVGRGTLLRRICYDLQGLPPELSEQSRFVSDTSPDAIDREIDRLLASPAYAERQAQHWLDLARYAETDGFEHDLVRPNAWRYRDWVIQAFNIDMPYDRFVHLQLAGDALEPDDPNALIATGFLLCGPDMPDINSREERRHFVLNEMTATVGSVFMGLQFGCAQCHDHKFDPITQHDFYRLRAFFDSVDIFRDHVVATPEDKRRQKQAEDSVSPEIRKQRQRREELERIGREALHAKNPDLQPSLKDIIAELPSDLREEHKRLVTSLKKQEEFSELPLGRVVQEGNQKRSYVFARGDFRTPGPEVSRGFPRVLDVNTHQPRQGELTRIELAKWLMDDDHPLVARVIVNRIWQQHFGHGLADSPSDFGVMGSESTNPELHDWLARRLTSEGWSLKQFHRLIVTSRSYSLASAPFDESWSPDFTKHAIKSFARVIEQDPNNSLHSRSARRRLDAESIRDCLLQISGSLSTRWGGVSIRPPLPPEVTVTLLKNQWPVNGDVEDHHRRTIYLFVRRNLRYPLLDVFDKPDTNASCPSRHESTTSLQALSLMNSAFSNECAENLARAIYAPNDPPKKWIERSIQAVLNREARDREIEKGCQFLVEQVALMEEGGTKSRGGDTQLLALADYCLALFNSNEFIYLD